MKSSPAKPGSNAKPLLSLLKTFYGAYKKEFALMNFFFLFQHSPVWFAPIIVARLVDLAVTPPPDRMFWFLVYGGAMVAMVSWNIPACMLSTRFLSRLTRGVSRDLRIAICGQLQQLTLLYNDKHSIGRMQSKAIRDIEILEQVPRQFLWLILTTGINIIVAMVAIGTRKPLALLFFVVFIIIASSLRQFFSGKLGERAKLYRTSFESMSVGMADMMTMIPVTRAHGLEEFELHKVTHKIHEVFEKGFRFDMLVALFGAYGWVSFTLSQTVFLLGSVYFCFKGQISVGDVVMFYSFFSSMSHSILALVNIMPLLSQVRESATSITEILHAPDREENKGKARVGAVAGHLVLKNVYYTYPGTVAPAINGFSLDIPAGQSAAFVGPSGCGKSTLLSLLLGFIRPTQGNIFLDGVDMQGLDLRTYRARVGVVSQDIVFFSGSILDNIQYGFYHLSKDHIIEALKFANAWEFVEKLPEGTDTRLGENGIKLSGGQKQRLAIARAVIRNPAILVLDEATSALDVESEMLVKEALDRIMQNRTTFVVAHRLSTVRNCSRIVVMEEGRVNAVGTHDELMRTRNFYSRIVEAIG